MNWKTSTEKFYLLFFSYIIAIDDIYILQMKNNQKFLLLKNLMNQVKIVNRNESDIKKEDINERKILLSLVILYLMKMLTLSINVKMKKI